jgi:hypothetical protein
MCFLREFFFLPALGECSPGATRKMGPGFRKVVEKMLLKAAEAIEVADNKKIDRPAAWMVADTLTGFFSTGRQHRNLTEERCNIGSRV